jgi:integrase/recombinase XerC
MLSRHDWAESTRKWTLNYLSDFSRFVADRQRREARICDLDILIVNAYVGAKRTTSEHTARAAAVTLRGLGGFIEESGIADNPLAKLRIPKPPEDVRQPLRDEQVRKLLAAAGDCPRPTQAARDQAIVALMLECGIRITECRLLETGDVDWPRRRIVVRSVTTKGRRITRDIRLGSIAAKALDRYVNDFRPQGDGALFLTLSGKPFRKGGMDSLVDHIVKRTGIDFSAHILRHTWATNFRRFKAGDLLDMQEEAGWSSKSMAKMARKYSHPKAFEERERITPLAGLMRIA